MMVGVVYGIDNTVHQVIIPDTDKQLQDPAWVAGGKTIAVAIFERRISEKLKQP